RQRGGSTRNKGLGKSRECDAQPLHRSRLPVAPQERLPARRHPPSPRAPRRRAADLRRPPAARPARHAFRLRARADRPDLAPTGISLGIVGQGSLSSRIETTDAQGAASVTYTAPATPTAITDTVTASLGPDTARATITVQPRATVTVSPPTVTVGPGARVQFSAQVTGATDQSVSWGASAG